MNVKTVALASRWDSQSVTDLSVQMFSYCPKVTLNTQTFLIYKVALGRA